MHPDTEQSIIGQLRSAMLIERIRDRNRIIADFRGVAHDGMIYVKVEALQEIVDPEGLTVVPDAVVN